ncbi:hypothetical protein ACYSNR_03090 [Enterococcus sp. LJL128]
MTKVTNEQKERVANKISLLDTRGKEFAAGVIVGMLSQSAVTKEIDEVIHEVADKQSA